jgi:hypothetical protein
VVVPRSGSSSGVVVAFSVLPVKSKPVKANDF